MLQSTGELSRKRSVDGSQHQVRDASASRMQHHYRHYKEAMEKIRQGRASPEATSSSLITKTEQLGFMFEPIKS